MVSSYLKPGQRRATTTTKELFLESGTVGYRNTAAWMRAEFKSCLRRRAPSSPCEITAVSPGLWERAWLELPKGRREGLGTSAGVKWDKNSGVFLVGTSLVRLVGL